MLTSPLAAFQNMGQLMVSTADPDVSIFTKYNDKNKQDDYQYKS